MNNIFVVIAACTLSYFLPQYKFQCINTSCSRFFSLMLSFYQNNAINNKTFFSYLLVFILALLSFVIPTLLIFYISIFSNIILFFLEIGLAYYLISVPSDKNLTAKQTNDDVIQNSTTIIQSIIMFVDDFFIPCFCIALLGLPCALLYRTFSYCTKKVLSSQNEHLRIIEKVHNILYFIPSYVIVLTILVASIFFPFCNTKNAYEIALLQRKTIKPFWLSRILAACFGSICIEVSVSFLENGTIITQKIGNVRSTINEDDVKSIHYILYCSGIIVLSFTLVFRLILTWGVW